MMASPARNNKGGVPLFPPETVIELFGDRRWHTLAEIMSHVRHRIRPEKAAWAYCNHFGGTADEDKKNKIRKERQEKPYEVQVAHGRQILAVAQLSSYVSKGRYEKRGVGIEKEYRLIAWHCWQCGKRQQGISGRNWAIHMCEPCDAALHPIESSLELESLIEEPDNALKGS